jgi:enterochelin esterase-like enzyme
MSAMGRGFAVIWRQVRCGWTAWRGLRRVALTAASVVCVAGAVTGAAGVYQYAETFWQYRGYAAPVLPVGVAAPTLTTITVVSPALGGFRDKVVVMLPPGYATDTKRRYPVLYLLHGFPAKPTDFFAVGDLESAYAKGLADGTMRPMIFVAPSGARSLFDDTEWANSSSSKENQWETFVARDLVNAIDARYRTIRLGSARGLVGYSEGGYAVLNIGLHHPGEFGLIESWSGYMVEDVPKLFGHRAALERYNSPEYEVVSAARALRASRTYIWFYCGTADADAPVNRVFAAELTRLRIPHSFSWEQGVGHTWALWRDLTPLSLQTASERLSHE